MTSYSVRLESLSLFQFKDRPLSAFEITLFYRRTFSGCEPGAKHHGDSTKSPIISDCADITFICMVILNIYAHLLETYHMYRIVQNLLNLLTFGEIGPKYVYRLISLSSVLFKLCQVCGDIMCGNYMRICDTILHFGESTALPGCFSRSALKK
jgi:hypothetical protein